MSKVEITYQGKQAWKHSDGSIRDSKGLYLEQTEQAKLAQIDSERGRQLAEDRWEATRQAVDEGMAEGLEVSSPVEAVGRMASAQSKIASDPANPRAVTAFNSLLTASQRVPGPRKQAGSQPGLQLSMDAGAVEALAGLLSRLPASETVDGSFTEERAGEAGGLAGGRVLPGEAGEDTETI